MGGVESRVGIGGRVGRDERQVARVGKLDQPRFSCLLDRVAAPGKLDVQPAGEELLQPVEIGGRLLLCPLGKQPGKCTLRARRQRNQAFVQTLELVEDDMRLFRQRPIEVRRRDELAQVRVALVVLGEQDQPIEGIAELRRPRDGEERPDHWLDALCDARVGKGHRRVKAVAVGQRHRRESELRCLGSDRLWLHRSFEHGEAGQDSKWDVRAGHARSMAPEFPD